MDSQCHEHGIYYFEDERGYMGSMLRALCLMIDTLDTPLTAAMLEELHTAAVSGTYSTSCEKNRLPAKIPCGYRHCAGVAFILADNATPAGLAEFNGSEKSTQDWISIRQTPVGKILQMTPKTALECRSKANHIINHYSQAIHRACVFESADTREQAILHSIAQCCQDLDQHHLFEDGNIRTIVFLCMNKLLLQNGYSPALWKDPNYIDMHSVEEIVGLIRDGQKAYQRLLT